MKRNNKITPEVYRWLIEQSGKLPELQKTLNGRPLFFKRGARVRTYTDEETKKTMREVKMTQVPVLLNHQVELIAIYQKNGKEACEEYFAWVRHVSDLDKKKKEFAEQAIQVIKDQNL